MSTITIVIVTLLFSAFFSGIEIAFVSSNRLKLELDKASDSFISKTIAIFSKDESNFIASMLIGNNIALVIFSISMTKLLDLTEVISSSFLLLFTQTIISTIVILITAEFIPKAIFRINSNYMLKIFSLPLIFFYFLLYPIVFIMISISGFVLKYIFRLELQEVNQIFSKIDLDEYLESLTQHTHSNSGNNIEVEMLQNALELSNIKVRECMVPRTDMAAINIKSSIEQLLKLFIETKYTKIPVFKGNIDNIIGYVHSSDLFKKPMTIKSIMLPIPIVSESLTANEMLNTFIKKNKSIALVVDEFGGTSGLVTVEDVTEEIVGEIEDEHDDHQNEPVTKLSDNEYMISANIPIDDFNKEFKSNLSNEDFDTLGGIVMHHFSRFPKINDAISIDNLRFIINSIEKRRLKKIKVIKSR